MLDSTSVSDAIAFDDIPGIRADGERIVIRLRIGTPYAVEDHEDEWRCSVSLAPLYERLRDATGSTSLQSLCLALSLAIDLLNGFCEDGGKLVYEDGARYPLEALAFGAAIRKPGAV
jgi:hypothetical protein